ncbi:MAG: phosphonate ABC transporter, permease protein PhnE [Verrucomicrobia bacterium]|jgi:phosphonate transport system permease protein|nr:phosphonate ABC transporter, permease protein PhnE [Verrucomicrobiota bacterium]
METIARTKGKGVSAEIQHTRGKSPLPAGDWRKRLGIVNLSFWLFVLLVISSLPVLQGSGRDVDTLEQMRRFFAKFLPPDLSILDEVGVALWETVQIAAMATAFGVVISLILGLAGARGLSPRWLVVGTRFGLNVIRTLPSLIWALLAVAMVGANTLAGVIGLTFYSVGYLGKFFSEAFESLDPSVAEALRRLGADRWQAFQYGLWPTVRPLVWGHTLWMLEYNIRSASIIGYVGAGGIGLQLLRYQEFGQWDRFATVLLCILVIVVGLDSLSGWIRRKLV